LNADVHTDIGALEKYLDLEEDMIVGINALPSELDINRTLFTTYTTLHITLHCMDKIFELKQEKTLKEYEEKIMNVRE
jgi:hypothetical protein